VTRQETSTTLIEALQKSLLSATRHVPGEVPPAAILWPDADGQWQPLISQLCSLMPQIIVLGSYLPEQRQGPAIWIRCVIERLLPEVQLPEGAVPIIYMPNISRQTLRDVEGCPDSLRPLVELQFRGTVWCQRNGKDWTVEAFFVSEDGGLELDVSKDIQTRRAMLGALAQLAVTPLSRLRGKRLEAEDFDKLMIEDTPRNLLEWLNDPRGMRGKWDESRWSAFRSRCKAEYGFDPETDGDIVGGEKLGLREGVWLGIWERFAESPALYPGIPELLQRAKPNVLIFIKETWPDENSKAEDSLRKSLLQLAETNAPQARERLGQLENEHAARREWVWAKLGMSPLSKAIKHLAASAKHTSVSLGGDSPKAMADLYIQGGYLADDTTLRALAEVKTAADHDAVSSAARVVYLPWIQDAAEHFQKLVAANPLPDKRDSKQKSVSAEPGTCILFVDGLRFDVGQRLIRISEDRKFKVAQGRRWAATPTVTGTAKAAVSPVSDQITGNKLNEDFLPEVVSTNQPLTSDRLRKLVQSAGYQWLSAGETGQPQAADARAWTEYGEFDKLGHNLQIKLANRIEDQLELLLDRIEMLLTAGWHKVRVVTDHGWLLMPGGLPNCTLPKYLTESRWSRCATIKAGAKVIVPTASWYWNQSEVFAFGTGIRCFGNGFDYAHGGMSLQECLIPDLEFTLDVATPDIVANIAEVQWVGMRCRICIEPIGIPLTVDIRTKVGDSATTITSAKLVDADGKAGLLVENESLVGTTVSVVLLDTNGHVIAKRATTIGGEE
jgi:hypothetical protein